MAVVIHLVELSHPSDKPPLFASQYLSLILLVTMLHSNIHNKNTRYSQSEQGTSPHLSLAVNYHLKIKRFFLSHLTLLFSVQSPFCERRFVIHLKYFLQFYPLKFGGFNKVVPLHPLKKTKQ